MGDFRKAWATACEAAGIPDKLFQTCAARRPVTSPVRVSLSAAIKDAVAHVERGGKVLLDPQKA